MTALTERASWSISEYAALHGLTRDVIYKRIREGKITVGRLWEGGHLRIFRSDFIEQVAEQIKQENER